MNQRLRIITFLFVLVGNVSGSHAQPPPGVIGSNPALDEAKRLTAKVEKLEAEGKFQEAISPAQRALSLRDKVLGPMHPDVARSLNRLASLYIRQPAYEKAEPLYVRALGIREKALGPMHLDVANALSDLGDLYYKQGAYAKAEPLWVRALGIREKALGPMHPDVANSLINLAALYVVQGREGQQGRQGAHEKAESLYVRALRILEKSLGPGHPNVANGLDGLGALYYEQEAYEKAEALWVRALGIRKKALGMMHPDVASNLYNLALLYEKQGLDAKAETLRVRALGILEKTLGPTHPDVVNSLNNLAVFYTKQGMYAKAEPLLARALDIREKTLGPMHPGVASVLHNLATLYLKQGRYARALPLRARASDILEIEFRLALARSSEARGRAMMGYLQMEAEGFVGLHADKMPSNKQALGIALAAVLRRKGLLLDSLVEQEVALRAHLTPALRAKLDHLAETRAELAARLYAPTGLGTAINRKAIDVARARMLDLESALSEASAEFRVQSEPVTVAKVQAVLPREAALVEFVRYRREEDSRPSSRRYEQEDRYVAYILSPHGPPQWIALGPAAAIDLEVDSVLALMDREVDPDAAKAALRRLDALVFAPVRTRLKDASHVIVASDSKLNLVPFEALVDPQGRYALERYLVSYVTTGRDLLRFGAHHRPKSSAVIVAGPDYGLAPTRNASGMASFSPLAGALGEASDLQRYFPTSPLTGARATKAALKAMTGPAMLHVATHGFYARDAGTSLRTAMPTALAQKVRERGMFVEGGGASSPPWLEDPGDALDRAGLAMAGANLGGDGIVTAREIAGLDLWGTQLVVLSACETGVGAVPSGDGVYGLRRALVLAGAESQVMSLWSVSDSSTRELMRDYYGRLAIGAGRAEALRQAKLHLMNQPGRAHPYYWAAFIQAGDWRPLNKNSLRHSERYE